MENIYKLWFNEALVVLSVKANQLEIVWTNKRRNHLYVPYLPFGNQLTKKSVITVDNCEHMFRKHFMVISMDV